MVNGLVTSLLVIKQLLLRSGNVEENPGPLGQHARGKAIDPSRILGAHITMYIGHEINVVSKIDNPSFCRYICVFG